MRQILVVLLLVGCGDPRAPFVGSYAGTGMRTINDGTTTDPASISLTLTAPSKSDRISFSGKCGWAAAVVDANTLQFDPASCPTFRGTAISGLMADFTDTYSGGTAELTGKSLVITLLGEEVGSNYSDGHPNQTFSIRDNMTLEKQ